MSKKKLRMPVFPPPRNSNTALRAKHVLYMGRTGSGKTSAVKQVKDVIPKGAQVTFFDPYMNYAGHVFRGQKVVYFREFAPFYKALVKARKTKGGFKLALVVPPTHGNMELFAQMVWAAGDGTKPDLHVVIEEMATASETVGKLKGAAGELWRGGRQFGLVMHSVFQKMQEVPKTVTSNSPNWWVGAVTNLRDAKTIADIHGLEPDQIAALKAADETGGIADYLFSGEGGGNVLQGQIDCRK